MGSPVSLKKLESCPSQVSMTFDSSFRVVSSAPRKPVESIRRMSRTDRRLPRFIPISLVEKRKTAINHLLAEL
jgi:hypothetical protein